MIVAVDTLFMSKRFRYSGTGMYLYHVLSECIRMAGSATPPIEFHAFRSPDENWAKNGFVSPFLRVHEARALASKRLWLLGGMAFHTARLRPELVFIPTALGAVPAPFTPLVSTILDAMPKRLPAEMLEVGPTAKYMMWISAKLARRVITISEWSKRDLVEIYGVSPRSVDVTYLGYDKHLYSSAPPDLEASSSLMERLGIRKPYILHHGTVQLRKNLHRLIRAWDRVLEKNPSFHSQLVLAGAMGLGHGEILKVREASPNREQIVLTGPLPDAELALVVKNASLCVIPSLYEGFCLPLVEAMACGIPTVASDSSCIPEVSGGLLEYFKPDSVEEMAKVIRRALEDSDLRESLRRRGLARASEFSWERCARETLRVFFTAGLEMA